MTVEVDRASLSWGAGEGEGEGEVCDTFLAFGRVRSAGGEQPADIYRQLRASTADRCRPRRGTRPRPYRGRSEPGDDRRGQRSMPGTNVCCPGAGLLRG